MKIYQRCCWRPLLTVTMQGALLQILATIRNVTAVVQELRLAESWNLSMPEFGRAASHLTRLPCDRRSA
jgi:hypothetical protein